MCLLHRPAAKTISDVWRWRRQGERKERETNCRMGGEHPVVSHIAATPLRFFFQLRWFGSKKSKNVYLHPPGLEGPFSFLLLVPIGCKNLPLLCTHHLLLLVRSPRGGGRYLCQVVGSSVCNCKLTLGETAERLLCREKWLATACKTHHTKSIHFMYLVELSQGWAEQR